MTIVERIRSGEFDVREPRPMLALLGGLPVQAERRALEYYEGLREAAYGRLRVALEEEFGCRSRAVWIAALALGVKGGSMGVYQAYAKLMTRK